MKTVEEIQWRKPWVKVESDAREPLEAELRREVGAEHPLYGAQLLAVGRRLDCDDVLFALTDEPQAYAVVHLTYAGRESSPLWPHTRFFRTLNDWVENCMRPDGES